ncbi:MAG: cyclic nucleotide-binding domain-containing protein [Sideroxydans sp.]|nr:cyclic nucleotide-binding domain-containing protein [Sideroxydans sp.]
MKTRSALLDEISGMLVDCDLFNHLPPAEIHAVAGYFNISRIGKGEAVFHEGDNGTFMCIVHEGSVAVSKRNQAGQEIAMATLPKGRAFGEMAVLDDERRSATCVAATDCMLLTLSRDALNQMLEETPRAGAKILRTIAVSLSRRLRMAVGKLVDYTL